MRVKRDQNLYVINFSCNKKISPTYIMNTCRQRIYIFNYKKNEYRQVPVNICAFPHFVMFFKTYLQGLRPLSLYLIKRFFFIGLVKVPLVGSSLLINITRQAYCTRSRHSSLRWLTFLLILYLPSYLFIIFFALCSNLLPEVRFLAACIGINIALKCTF